MNARTRPHAGFDRALHAMNRLLLGIGVPSLLILGWGPAQAAPLPVSVAPVQMSAWRPEIVVLGRVKSLNQTLLVAPFEGRVGHLTGNPGNAVKPGQVILDVIPLALGRQIKQAEAQRAFAQRNLRQTRSLFRQQLQTRQQFEHAQLELRLAQQQLSILERRLALGQVRAPFAGTVSYLVASGVRVHARDPVARVEGPGTLWVAAHLTPSQARRVRAGARAALADGERQTANVYAVGATADAFGLVPVYLTPQRPAALLAGEAVRVTLYGTAQTGAAVPLHAVVMRSGKTRVYVIDHGKARAVPVRVQHIQSGKAWVEGALPPGARIIVQGSGRVRNGTPVAISPVSGAGH
ncbi:MAG: efflux RND transporter periplasmic adaptor subunit [Gammaproteobacteria bacterium]|nr:efflux RND transporter periplasmic adaptor subunit [Gammaproteobacteria bacterium]